MLVVKPPVPTMEHISYFLPKGAVLKARIYQSRKIGSSKTLAVFDITSPTVRHSVQSTGLE